MDALAEVANETIPDEGSVDRLVVFFRHHNDIDHIAPVVYRWAEQERSPVNVVLLGGIDVATDYRLRFLDRYQSVSIQPLDAVGRTEAAGDADSMGSTAWLKQSAVGSVKDLGRALPSELPERLYRLFRRPAEWTPHRAAVLLDDLVDSGDAAVLVFDWAPGEANPEYQFVREMIEVARDRGYPSVALPHAAGTFCNALSNTERVDDLLGRGVFGGCDVDLWTEAYYTWERMNIFDFVVVPNEIDRRRAEGNVVADKIVTLGSPRYAPEWISVLDSIAPTFEGAAREPCTTVALFLGHEANFLSRETVEQAVRLLAQLPDVHVAIQNHPRGEFLDESTEIFSGVDLSATDSLELADEVQATSLIQWADVTMQTGSSVVLETVMRDKRLLTLEFASATRSAVSPFLPRTAIESLDEFYHAVCSIASGDCEQTYDAEERERFIRERILGGKQGRVLSRYTDFLSGSYRTE